MLGDWVFLGLRGRWGGLGARSVASVPCGFGGRLAGRGMQAVSSVHQGGCSGLRGVWAVDRVPWTVSLSLGIWCSWSFGAETVVDLPGCATQFVH